MDKISWTDRVRNEEVLHRVKEERNILHAVKYDCVGDYFGKNNAFYENGNTVNWRVYVCVTVCESVCVCECVCEIVCECVYGGVSVRVLVRV
jgi:hypothetical protein